jgi:nitrate/nitrite transporter NarK
VGHAGGFFGPYIVGDLNMRTGSLKSGFAFIACCYILAAFFVARLNLRASAGAVVTPVPQSLDSASLE